MPDDTDRRQALRRATLLDIERAQVKAGDLSGAWQTIGSLPAEEQIRERLSAGDIRAAQDLAATMPKDTYVRTGRSW